MSQARYQLPERPRMNQPTSRFNYRVQLQRSPTVSRGDASSPFGHEQSIFTFDHSTGKSKSKHVPLFDPFEDSNIQTIAKNVIEQNILLKEELKKNQQLIKDLEEQLVSCRIQMEQLSRINPSQKLLEDIKEQIYSILSKNKLVEEELNNIRKLLPMTTDKIQPKIDSLLQYNNYYTRCRSTSLDFKRTSYPIRDQRRQTLQPGKHDQLVCSIKNMHLKITGFRVQSLKELWRWLKSVGYTYSTFKKWQYKLQSSVQSWQCSPQKMRHLLEEVIIDC